MLDAARSSFYAWRRQTGQETTTAAQLNEEGHPRSVGLVAELMRELDLRAVQPWACKTTTVPGEERVPAIPELIRGDIAAGGQPWTRLVGDITYLRTEQGWLHLATVIDLATRRVVGWQMVKHMRTSLVVEALQTAHAHGHLEPSAVFKEQLRSAQQHTVATTS